MTLMLSPAVRVAVPLPPLLLPTMASTVLELTITGTLPEMAMLPEPPAARTTLTKKSSP